MKKRIILIADDGYKIVDERGGSSKIIECDEEDVYKYKEIKNEILYIKRDDT